MKKKWIGLTVVIASCFVGATVVASAQDGSSPRGESASETTTFCDGGAQKSVVQNVVDNGQTFAEGAAYSNLDGSVPFSVPTGAFDTVTVTLASEARMSGASPTDRIEVKAQLDGVDMEPVPTETQFHSGNAVNSHAAMWCEVVGEGSHSVQIVARVLDLGTAGTVTGTFDETFIRVEVSE